MLDSLYRMAIAATILSITSASALAQDVDAGKKVFKKCQACHTVGEDAENKVGPHLNDLFGRKAGSVEDYKYSKAMVTAGDEGLIWSEETLDEYLAAPKKMIKKTKMSFPGLKKEEDRASVNAYLQSFSSAVPEEEASESSQPEPVESAD